MNFEDSIARLAGAVPGVDSAGKEESEGYYNKTAISEVLKYYKQNMPEIPESVRDPEEQLEYCIRSSGIMYRRVKLEKNWYKEAFCPIIAVRKEDGLPTALLPKTLNGFRFYDSERGKMRSVGRRTAGLFEQNAVCFYRPLPMKSLGITDLLLYLRSCLSVMDTGFITLLTLLTTAIGLLMPRLNLLITGLVLESQNVSLLLGTAVFMLSALVSRQLVNMVKELGISRLRIKTAGSVEAAMMMRVLGLPVSFFRQYSAGEFANRLSSVGRLCGLLVDNIFVMGVSSLSSLLYINQISHFAPSLARPALYVILITAGAGILFSVMEMGIMRASLEENARNEGISYGILRGMQKIRTAGAEKRAFSKWARTYSRKVSLIYDLPFLLKIKDVIISGIALAGTVLFYYIAVESGVSQSEYIAFTTSYALVMGAFSSVADVARAAAGIKPILDIAAPILDKVPESSGNKLMVTSLQGGIEVSNLCFRYGPNMPYVLDGLNLKIKPGESVAIVGRTGCGKSTLVRLLLGFEIPEKGAIYYDGRNLAKLEPRSLRRRIGTVIQDAGLLRGEILSNITLSSQRLTEEDAWAAAETAGIADEIRSMPMGMHTMIGEGDGGISGGQKQKILIARAAAGSPKIMIFDEATGALDERSEKHIAEALERTNCTRIVIAHRLSTVRNCDRILMMEGGKIAEEGTYEELIGKKGRFAKLAALQMR